MSKQSKKMFQEIVSSIQHIIEEDKLTPGSKIPSERELAERLGVGRSSIREGLRALELLGIIETRRGEGTFLCDIANHKVIDMIGMFLISKESQVTDLEETLWAIESYCIQNVMKGLDSPKEKLVLAKLVEIFKFQEDVQLHVSRYFVKECGNFMMYRIWKVLKNYEMVAYQEKKVVSEEVFQKLTEEIKARNIEKILLHYQELMGRN